MNVVCNAQTRDEKDFRAKNVLALKNTLPKKYHKLEELGTLAKDACKNDLNSSFFILPMKEITKTYRVFSFEELSPEAQEKAIEKFRDINVDYYWSEPTIWDWKDKLIEQGFLEPEIQFSGFWSQGDGASFTAKVDALKFLSGQTKKIQEKFKPLHDVLTGESETNDDYKEVKFSIERNDHRNVHEYSCGIFAERFGQKEHTKEENELLEELEKLIEEQRLELCREIYKSLEEEYNYRTMESAVKETLIENEYQFLEDGSLFTE